MSPLSRDGTHRRRPMLPSLTGTTLRTYERTLGLNRLRLHVRGAPALTDRSARLHLQEVARVAIRQHERDIAVILITDVCAGPPQERPLRSEAPPTRGPRRTPRLHTWVWRSE